ncbi:MAG TPA: 3'-5' exoribonuclease, partial [Polyangiaceae bacterium]|nr:3'-5' exoribonuclease [Polyangiaceae bacterium]
FALVSAGTYDGVNFRRGAASSPTFYRELRPISENFEEETLRVNGLDRDRLLRFGELPEKAMTEAAAWVKQVAGSAKPVLVAYPMSFDWLWLYWYFVRYAKQGSPFSHSQCFDVKTAFAVKARLPISRAGRSKLPDALKATRVHTHNALDDAAEQAEIFANILEWEGLHGRDA